MNQEPNHNAAYIIDAESAAEMARLIRQADMVSEALAGDHPLIDRSRSSVVLDLAGGPGEWVFRTAEAFPKAKVIGVDVSNLMIEYAKGQREIKNLPNTEFRVMNITQTPFDFAADTFHFINIRLLFGVLSPEDWPPLLLECQRILKPGGIVRLTEPEFPVATSLATERIYSFLLRALQHAGRAPLNGSERALNLTAFLRRFLQQAGFTAVQTKSFALDYSFGTAAHSDWTQNVEFAFELMAPFILKERVVDPETFRQVMNQLKQEQHDPDFSALVYWTSAWGKKPKE